MADDLTTDTSETVPSDASEVASLFSNDANTIKTTSTHSTHLTDVTEEDIKHDNIPSDYKHKERRDRPPRGESPSPSPSVFKQKESSNVSLLKVLDSKPVILQGNNEQPGSEVVDAIFNEIYFDGNWNRGHYALASEDEDYPEYQSKLEQRQKFGHPLAVFGDDDLFTLLPNQTKQNREQCTFYAPLEFTPTPYPLPSQRLKRVLYPFKGFKNMEQKTPNFKERLEGVAAAEQEYYARIRGKATRLKELYAEITAFQTNKHTKELFNQKKEFWHKLQYEMNEQNVGVVSEHNIPPWIMKGWYGDCALARNRNLRMPQYKAKTFKSFYPKTARWDRIMRGCYELDWNDEDVIMDIIKYDATKYKTPFEVILSLRRACLFGEECKAWTEFKPFARDPFVHIYDFYNVTEVTLAKDNNNNVYQRMRDLYWTLSLMWYVGSRFDTEGCLRCPALCSPIEWTYCVALKLIWDGIKLFGVIGKLHQCSMKHCGIGDAGNKTMQFLKKVTYAFDFNLAQIYDFRYILYLLRHTLFNHLYHVLSKHAGKYQVKVFSRQKKDANIEMAHNEDYRFVLDYFKLLVTSNNMYEFFSPLQMGRLWQYISGTFEEFRMIYPEISINTIENEYCDLIETHRHMSVTKTMTAKSYAYYCGNKYSANKEKNIWSDARGVIKQYCIRNTLFPVPDMFETLYADITTSTHGMNINDDMSDSDTHKYKRSKLEKYISEIVMNAMKSPTAFYLTEIKYPFLCNLMRACIKYEFHELAQLLLNHCITKAINTYDVVQSKSTQLFQSNAEYKLLNKSQRRYLETAFAWPYVLFIEYLSFNPSQFHREHLCHIIQETEHFKRAIQKEKQNYTAKSQRKILSYSNRIKLQKQKYDSWQRAVINETIPVYPLAALLRFAVSERTNSKLDDDDELIRQGTDFTITKCVISALQTMFKFTQFATRILMNTHNLKHLIHSITYIEFKTVYAAIFKYNAKYQEHPAMYEVFKKKWMEYAKQIKSLLEVYHEPHHKLHRELVWLGFYQYHKNKCYGTANEADKDKLFEYHATTHFTAMLEKYKMQIELQEENAMEDVRKIFKQFGYNDDTMHRFYGNYYREFVEREEDDSDDESGSEESSSGTASTGTGTVDSDEGTATDESYVGSEEEEEVEAIRQQRQQQQARADEDAVEEEDEDNSFVDTEDDVSEEDESDESKDEEEDENADDDAPPKHRRMNTETQERAQFANQFDIEDIEDDANPFGHRYEDSDEEDIHLEKKHDLKVNDADDLDDFDEIMDGDENEDKNKPTKESKARGSNEYNAEDVQHIKKQSPAESPLLSNITEDVSLHHLQDEEEEEDDADDLNPFGLPMDDDEDDEDEDGGNGDTDQKQPQPQSNHDNADEDIPQDTGDGDGDDYGQNGFGGSGAAGDDDGDDEKKRQPPSTVKEEEEEEEVEEEEEEDETDGLGDISAVHESIKMRKHSKKESDMMIVEALNEMVEQEVNLEEEEAARLAAFHKDNSNGNNNQNNQNNQKDGASEMKVNIGNTVRHLTKRGGILFGDDEEEKKEEEEEETDAKDEEDEDVSDDSDDDEDDDLDGDHDGEFRANKEWANTLLNNLNIVGMQSRDAMLARKEEQDDLYKRHQVIGRREDEEENIYSLLDLENTQFIDEIMFMNDEGGLNKQLFGEEKMNDALVADINQSNPSIEDEREEEEEERLVDIEAAAGAGPHFDDNSFFEIRAARWSDKRSDPIAAVSGKEAENSYVMLRDLTEPLHLSELLGDFQKAGQIMLSRIDDMQASLIVENKLHCGVLKAHQMDEKQLYVEREQLLNSCEKLESELKLLRDKRDENKSETAALKTKQESYILKYNELKEVSTQKLRDQLRCFEIYKAQTKQLEKRISDASYQTEIGYKRLNRLVQFKKQQQLNISQLDLEIESMEKEKFHQTRQLDNLEEEQAMIDENEAQYVARLKEQLRRLGKGMENKEKSCNIYRRNVVEERLRIHAIDDSLKKLRTNANPTTESDQELINATQHEALQAREKYAERSQQHSFLNNIASHERVLIECIEKVQNIDDAIYSKKWNIIQKSWNLKKELLESGKLIQMKKYLLKKEKSQKRHKKKLSQSHFRKDSMKNLSHGAAHQFKKQSRDFTEY